MLVSSDTGSRQEEEAGDLANDDEEEEVDTLRCRPCLRLTIPRAVSGVPALARAADRFANNPPLLRPTCKQNTLFQNLYGTYFYKKYFISREYSFTPCVVCTSELICISILQSL